MLVSMTSKHSRTEFVRELYHELPRSVSTFDGEEIQKGEVQEKGLKDLAFHGELEGVEWCVRILEGLLYSQLTLLPWELSNVPENPLQGCSRTDSLVYNAAKAAAKAHFRFRRASGPRTAAGLEYVHSSGSARPRTPAASPASAQIDKVANSPHAH